jgi:PqqA peptide cyclase
LQLSFQSATEELAEEISGSKTHQQKLRVLNWLQTRRIAVTLNFVIHRRNIDQIESMLAIAESAKVSRVEFANVQYYGWALANRTALLPTRRQLDESLQALKEAQERLRGKIRIESVVPDYYAKYPKQCMGGWGRKLMLIAPEGAALPCHAARVIPDLQFDNVRARNLRDIWSDSQAFQKFRGQSWMQEPCKSCERREQDFGGCRCQALLLTGDASATDPVCSLSPQRTKVDAILNALNVPERLSVTTVVPAKIDWVYRPNP